MTDNLLKATAALLHETIEEERDAVLDKEKALRGELAELREKLDAATVEIETERAAKKEARESAAADVTRLEKEIETVSILLGEVQTADADREKSLRQELTDLREKLDAAAAELETERAAKKEAREAAAADVARLEKEIETISTLLSDAETNGADREKDLREELARLKGDLGTAREDLDARLKAEKAERVEGHEQIDTLKTHIKALDARLADERAAANDVVKKIKKEIAGVSKDHLFQSVIVGEIGTLKSALSQFCIETGQKRAKQLGATAKGTPVAIAKYAEETLR